MRTEYKEITKLNNENNELKNKLTRQAKQLLRLEMENAELKDKLINAGQHAETDGYEVGSPSDYEEDKQLSFDFEIEKTSENDFEVKKPMMYESPDGGKTIYGRRAGDIVREQFNRECD